MNLNKIISLLVLSCATNIACTQYLPEENLTKAIDNDKSSTVITKSNESEPIKSYEVLENPYALDVMQAVYNSHGVNKTLEPTHLYVRFMPADSSQLYSLTYGYGLELFDYPLDIELSEGDVYIDPTVGEGELSWQYTTVAPDFKFPEGISHEILQECYIPADDEVFIPTKGGSPISVEEEAFLSLGYKIEPETKAGAYPKGRIRVYDDYVDINGYIPLRGVKIRCHTFVKWANAYTDENGDYWIDKKFLVKPHYAIVFENVKGFDIWGNWGPLAKANYNMGWHSKQGYSKDIDNSCKAWEWAMVNNAASDYYSMCSRTGITFPPENLKIWVFKSKENFSSAPMLRRVNNAIGFNGHNKWENFFINIGYGTVANSLNFLIKYLLPDITIGTNNHTSSKIYTTVNHELSHASHCAQVGSSFWAKYVSYIMTYGAYGDGTGKNAELCGIGEMWGYCMGTCQKVERYGINSNDINLKSHDGWIHPDIFWQLIKNNTLTKKQIFDCLTADVTTYDLLVERMYAKYPHQADAIEKEFHNHGIYPNVQKPQFDNLKDQTISASRSVTGQNIVVQNVFVTNNATLTLKSETSITINAPFFLEKDSQLIFTKQ